MQESSERAHGGKGAAGEAQLALARTDATCCMNIIFCLKQENQGKCSGRFRWNRKSNNNKIVMTESYVIKGLNHEQIRQWFQKV